MLQTIAETRSLRVGDRVAVHRSPHVTGPHGEPKLLRLSQPAAGVVDDVLYAEVLAVGPAPVGRGGAVTRGWRVVETDLGDITAPPAALWVVELS